MKTKIFLILSFIILISSNLTAQKIKEWVNRYNHTSDSTDYGWSVKKDNSNNIYVAGQVYNDSSKADICLIKYDMSGLIQWIKTFNGPANGDDFAGDLVLDNVGNIYITGGATRPGTGSDFCTMKFNSSGNTEWVSYYNSVGDSVDAGDQLVIDNLSNLYIIGSIKGNSSDLIVIKYNPAGEEQWVRTHNGPANDWDRTNGIEIDDSNNVYVLGFISTISSGLDYYTIKYNSSGIQQWARSYNGTGNNFDLPNAIALDDSANVLITGTSVGVSSGDFLTIKYDRNGNLRWTQRYNAPANNSDAGSGIAVDNGGNVYAFGESVGIGSDYDWLLIKYNSAGEQQWLERFNGPGNSFDDADDILIGNNAEIYLMGASTGIGSNLDYLLIKYDSTGSMIWQQRYNGTGNYFDFPSSIFLDNSDNIFLTGNSMNASGNMDIVTIKFSESTGFTQLSNSIPGGFDLHQNYPNPFNPITVISYSLNKNRLITLKVFDNQGREIQTLINEKQSVGNHEVVFDGSNLSSGVYFYKIEAEVEVATKRMVLLK